jgi:hypothetical protein
MLQAFYVDIAKVDRDLAYVAMVVHICCKLLFSMFQLFLQTYLPSVFVWMFNMFYTYVASVFIWMLCMFYMVFKCLLGVSASVSDAYFVCFICLRTYVASVAFGCFKSRPGVASCSLLAFDYLASVSPPSLGAGWASEPEA